MVFVFLPVQTSNTPVAKGSSVPACPTFLTEKSERTFLTTSKAAYQVPKQYLHQNYDPHKGVGGAGMLQ
jgi:hypothetical protein